MASESALTASGTETIAPSSSASELGERVVLEERDLAGEPDDRGAGLGRPRGLGAHQHDLAELLLERFDALADGRGRHVQAAGRGIQRAFIEDSAQRLGQLDRNTHDK